ncbi:hypothetical protein HY030_00835 [Candidatus Gottesmanbacteria bacterium]|nr:hypothetical protein [Candidatus Gottesmanbacteria bacterium]
MISVAHSLVAVSIAAKIPNPIIAFPLSFFSNYLLDMIPHWDFGYGWRAKSKKRLFLEGASDVAVSYILVFLIWQKFLPHISLVYLLANAFLSQLPDWLELPYVLFNVKVQPFVFFYQIQHLIHRKLALPWGIVTQIVTVLPLLYFALH